MEQKTSLRVLQALQIKGLSWCRIYSVDEAG